MSDLAERAIEIANAIEAQESAAGFDVPMLLRDLVHALRAVAPAGASAPSAAAIAAAWDANARCGIYAASKEGIAAALRAAYAVDFGAAAPRDALSDAAFQRLWTKYASLPNYEKAEWTAAFNEIWAPRRSE